MRAYEAFELLHNPIWIFDLDSKQVVWANKPALLLWESGSLQELVNRDLHASMSMAVEATLEQYRKKFQKNEKIRTWWSFTPKHKLKCALCVFSGIEIEPNRTAMLVEVVAEQNSLKRDIAFSGGGRLSLLFDDKGELISANEAFRLTFNSNFHSLGDFLSSQSRAKQWIQTASSKQELKDEISFNLDGKPHHFEISAQWLADNNQLLLNLTDITEKKQRLEEARFNAHHDYLTGLFNRRGMLDVISEYVIQKVPFVLAFLDLDGFKLVNDTYGHGVGDELLKSVTKRLKEIVDPSCSLGRFGGDEFVVLFPEQSKHQVDNKLHQIIQMASIDYPISNIGELSITSSIGASHFPTDSQNVEELIKQAGMAMHYAKSEGRNRFELFSSELSYSLNRKVLIRNRLTKAFDKRAFKLVFQPIVQTENTNIKGVEVLLRWDDSKLGSVSPEEFIPIAEETGQIVEIADWVFDEVGRTLSEWKPTLPDEFVMSINVSQIQLNSSLHARLKALLHQYGLSGKNLALEIAEPSMALKHADCVKWLDDIKELGVNVFLDNFGTGYSSLASLDSLPIKAIKLDKRFISQKGALSKDEVTNKTVLKATAALCDALKLDLIAVGVETNEQKQLLSELGCRYYQGYLVSKPLHKSTIEQRFLNVIDAEA
ncbi:EAL domain-containing protein [Vibrio penaeicida]|uniref:sensor domain-containing protein n=1 Tax=Vibrio penaeicida TaxID=104609 RepID=UPI00273294FC|nr:EAL domain-containing protein [Vibrio penaeicida]MDP2574686.1 EAL domain-containing protein [Vibrio penaeicida]